MMNEYITSDGEPVPDDVAEQFAHPEDWEQQYLDPQSVATPDCLWADLYCGVAADDLDGVYVDKRGNVYDADRFENVTKLLPASLPRYDMTRTHPFTYNSDPDVVDHDHFIEHITKVIVVEEDGRVVLNSRSGVCWFDYKDNDGSDEAVELAVSLAETRIPHGTDNCELETPDEYTRALNGWHSSLEKSEQSELINALCAGDVDPAFEDNEAIDVYPYAVRFGDTTNVCAQPASVYTHATFAGELERVFDNKRARPGHAGFN